MANPSDEEVIALFKFKEMVKVMIHLLIAHFKDQADARVVVMAWPAANRDAGLLMSTATFKETRETLQRFEMLEELRKAGEAGGSEKLQ